MISAVIEKPINLLQQEDTSPIIPFNNIKDIKYFERYLRRENLSDSTIAAYTYSVKLFYSLHHTISKNSLLAYKTYLIEKYSPASVNLRILGINKYLKFLRKSSLALKCVKVQQKCFLDNVISKEDYKTLLRYLKNHNRMTLYYIVKYMTCTGARVSEVIKFKVEHVKKGYMDIYSKGGKFRRIYIPRKLQNDSTRWLSSESIDEGYIFLNKNSIQFSTRGIAKELKECARNCKSIPLETVYPHSFRHRFAINFLEKNNDTALLMDIMGHSNISATLIYLRRTSREQYEIISKIVDW
mgnify:CR=1 FL=1